MFKKKKKTPTKGSMVSSTAALGDRFFVHDMSGKAERSGKDAEPEICASKVGTDLLETM